MRWLPANLEEKREPRVASFAKAQTGDSMFWFPLTQEIIADALSLSVPYVNRVLHQLRDEGLVQMKKHQIYIQNVEELSALADFRQDYLQPRPIAEIRA